MPTPVKREQLERLEELGGEDMVFEWLAQGGTLTNLATRIDVSRQVLSQYCNRRHRRERYKEARRAGAEAFVEQGLDLVDDANPENVQVRKLQSDYRRFMAGKLDHDAWGEKGAQGGVTVNFNNLHLEAVRQLSQREKVVNPDAGEDWLNALEHDEGEGDWLE